MNQRFRKSSLASRCSEPCIGGSLGLHGRWRLEWPERHDFGRNGRAWLGWSDHGRTVGRRHGRPDVGDRRTDRLAIVTEQLVTLSNGRQSRNINAFAPRVSRTDVPLQAQDFTGRSALHPSFEARPRLRLDRPTDDTRSKNAANDGIVVRNDHRGEKTGHQ